MTSQEENVVSSLAFTRSGTGAPLVLLHGIGLSRQAWDPVVPALARHFDVIAVDLPGFGGSAPVPAGTARTGRDPPGRLAHPDLPGRAVAPGYPPVLPR